MKATILAIALAWSIGFMMACGAILNANENNPLSDYGYVKQGISNQEMQELVSAVVVWPYYIGKYFTAK